MQHRASRTNPASDDQWLTPAMGHRTARQPDIVDSRQSRDGAPAVGGPSSSPTQVIVGLDAAISLEDGGGKAVNLARLMQAGLPVPRGFVIPTTAYREYLSSNGLDGWPAETARAARVDDPAELDAASAAIRARFAAGIMAGRWAEAIRAAYAALGRPA